MDISPAFSPKPVLFYSSGPWDFADSPMANLNDPETANKIDPPLRGKSSVIKFALSNKKNLAALNKVSGRTVKTRQGLTIGTVWLLYQLAKRLGIVNALGRSGMAKFLLSFGACEPILPGRIVRNPSTR